MKAFLSAVVGAIAGLMSVAVIPAMSEQINGFLALAAFTGLGIGAASGAVGGGVAMLVGRSPLLGAAAAAVAAFAVAWGLGIAASLVFPLLVAGVVAVVVFLTLVLVAVSSRRNVEN